MFIKRSLPPVALAALLGLGASPRSAPSVTYAQRKVLGASVNVVTVDLTAKDVLVAVVLARDAARANSPKESFGDESWDSFVARTRAAALVNGTFFSKDRQKRVMGNMIRDGEFVKFSEWEHGGTAFSIRAGNVPEIAPGLREDLRGMTDRWLLVTAGPRLLEHGQVLPGGRMEGFRDSHVLGTAIRTTLGYSRDRKRLYLATLSAVSLARAAEIMRELGCHEAMNLDGGASQALAFGSRSKRSPGRRLTNVIAVYDASHPAPKALKWAWLKFNAYPLASWRPFKANLGPGEREIRHFREGESLDFLGLTFVAAGGDPIVGTHGGEMAFSPASTGHVYAPWPTRQEEYALEFEAKAEPESFEAVLDADGDPGPIYGTRLEYRTSHPVGLFLRRGWDLLGMNQWVPIDQNWHRVRVEAAEDEYRVYFDDMETTALTASRGVTGKGMGLGGRGMFRKLGWSALE